ncbi:MAG: hypothetical protein HC822_22790 [Oscillochloris sp.]|nr:hypothetical protein [Oscillochloris sp.]
MAILPPILRAGTPDVPDVPPLIQWLMGEFLAPIMAWLETRIYRRMLARCAKHPLVLLNQWYDPAPVIAACAGFHHTPGTPGATPTYTVAQFVRAELVRAWAGSCSDRDLEELLTTNLLVRWYVGLPLTHPGPDHSTLATFHAWMTIHAPDALFADVLAFLDRVDPEDPVATPQIVDTFAMASPVAATPTTAHLLADLTLRLIRLWQQHAPADVQPAIPPLDLSALADLPIARTPITRQQRLQAVVTVVRWVVDGLTPHVDALPEPTRSAVQSYLTHLAKVQADDLTTDATGFVTELPTNQRGSQRLASAVDREATFRNHGDGSSVLGWNAVISTTATRMRACVALTGATSDSDAPIAAIQQQQAANQPLPAHMVMDQAGGYGKTRARVAAVSDDQTRLVARIPQPGGTDGSRFGPADFRVDLARTRCTCPHGVTSTACYRKGDGDGIRFRFLASQCGECPLWNECREPTAKPTGHRTVYITDYHAILRVDAAFNQAPEGRALLGSRWRVEPVIAWVVQWQGCRRARRLGQAAAQCQLFQGCAVRNLRSWISRVQRNLAPAPRC